MNEIQMSLHIDDQEVVDLANELARLTGQTVTVAIRDALRRQRDLLQRDRQQRHEARVADLLAIAGRCAAHLRQPGPATAHGTLLYDDQGLPRID